MTNIFADLEAKLRLNVFNTYMCWIHFFSYNNLLVTGLALTNTVNVRVCVQIRKNVHKLFHFLPITQCIYCF